MNTEKTMLRFLGYRVDKMVFVTKKEDDSSSDRIVISPSFSRKIEEVDKNEYDVTIGVELKQSNLPFDAELSIAGRFSYEGKMDVEKVLKVNAVAIMYPYVRSTLSLMTTLAAIPPVIIPTINLVQMFEKEEQTQG